jgi:addiction module HigA family antidote
MMHNPPHPGELLATLWLAPLNLSIAQTAKRLNVSRKAISELVNGKTRLSTEMALRLEIAFGKSAASWLAHQAAFDLWKLEDKRTSLGVQPSVIFNKPGDIP